MWDKGEFVTIIIRSDSLCLSWFQQVKKTPLLFRPCAWVVEPLDALQIENSVIFNPTYLADIILKFLTRHALKNAFVSLGLSQNTIWERCCWVEQEPTVNDVCNAHSLIWNYVHVLNHKESQKNLFYLFGMAREVLFQYQLLALKVPFHCSTITSKNRALLYILSQLDRPLGVPHTFEGNSRELTDSCMTAFDSYGYDQLFQPRTGFNNFLLREKEAVMTSLGLYLLGNSYALH